MKDRGLTIYNEDAEKSKPAENSEDCSGESAEERDQNKCAEEIQSRNSCRIEIEQLEERVL